MFNGLVALIIDNTIFSNNFNCPQLPVHIQLAIFLFRAGHYGNAMSPEDVAQWAGISVGGVEKCTDCVIVSLLSLHDEAIHFPGVNDKEKAKEFVAAQTCEEWRNGFLIIDGTKFPLYQRPGLHGDAWYNKGGEYSIDCQVHAVPFLTEKKTYSFCQLIVLPHNLMIVDYSIGHTGSVHDSWAFCSTCTFKEHNQVLGPGEWLWADSAYPCELWSVSPFKKPACGKLSHDERTFNYHLLKVRLSYQRGVLHLSKHFIDPYMR
jgi:hypothetical protein